MKLDIERKIERVSAIEALAQAKMEKEFVSFREFIHKCDDISDSFVDCDNFNNGKFTCENRAVKLMWAAWLARSVKE